MTYPDAYPISSLDDTQTAQVVDCFWVDLNQLWRYDVHWSSPMQTPGQVECKWVVKSMQLRITLQKFRKLRENTCRITDQHDLVVFPQTYIFRIHMN